jgi:hypothetical protein
MNHILYNFALIMLFGGIILLTIYITKASSNGYKTTDIILMEQQKIENQRRGMESNKTIYDSKPSKIFDKMFLQPSVWVGYDDFDENDIRDKIYVKNA